MDLKSEPCLPRKAVSDFKSAALAKYLEIALFP
jgi:hypothetical protein